MLRAVVGGDAECPAVTGNVNSRDAAMPHSSSPSFRSQAPLPPAAALPPAGSAPQFNSPAEHPPAVKSVGQPQSVAQPQSGDVLNDTQRPTVSPAADARTEAVTVGQRIRELRKSRNLTQRQLADRVGINFTYLSRVENDRLDDEQTPREETLQRIASALESDPNELLLLARRIPDAYRDRILSQPGVFRKLLNLSDHALEELLQSVEERLPR